MANRLSDKDKEELIKLFSLGKTIDELSAKFKFTKLTISRNLKKSFGEKKYKELINNKNKVQKYPAESKKEVSLRDRDPQKNSFLNNEYLDNKTIQDEETFSITNFVEITPLDYEIENTPQKDLSSIPISEIKFPNNVYMIVDKKIELEIKNLKDYPGWQFLSKQELNRKTIEIFEDLKTAKSFCNKEQKIIKVPNPDVLKVAAPLLLSRGISRIISADKLIAL